MKIAHLNNIANNALNYVLALRRRGVDAHLFYDKISHDFSQPNWELPGITKEIWINQVENSSRFRVLTYFRYLELIKKLSKYNIISAWDVGPIWAQFARKPFIVHSAGGDLLAVLNSATIKERLLRRAYDQAKCVVYYMPHQDKLLTKIKIKKKIFSRLPIDEKRYSPGPPSEKFKALSERNVLLLCLSRQSFLWKGSDMLLKAYSKALKEEPCMQLIAVKWGTDLEKSLYLCKKLGLEDKVIWVPPMRKKEMIGVLRACEVVLDQFVLGSYGALAIEALMCAKPVVIKVEGYDRYYKDPLPFVNVNNEQELASSIVVLAQDYKLRKSIGRYSRDWAVKNHSYESVSDEYLAIVNEVLSK